MGKILAGFLLAMFWGSAVFAFDPYPRRAQLSDKLIGVTWNEQCPTEDVLTFIRLEGKMIGADYTVIVQPVAQSFCLDTINGQMWSYVHTEPIPGGATTTIAGGVVVGFHYKQDQ